MADNKLPPADEARVRTAATVAAERMAWNVPRQVLDYIIATSNPKESPAALEVRAAGIVEYAKNHPEAGMLRDNTDKAAHGFLQIIHGQVMSQFGGLPWTLATARENSSTTSASGEKSYASLETSWDSSNPQKLNPKNWSKSPFCGISGLDIGTTQSLLASGFRTEQIMQAGRDVNKLEIDTKQNIARAARLNKEAPGFMPKAHRYKGELDSATKTEGAIAKDEARLVEMEKQGQANSPEATTLRENIARQKHEVEQARQQAEKRAEDAVKVLPEARKEDGREIIKAIREKDLHRRREFGAHTLNENHEARLRDNKAEGVQERVEAAHAARVASRQANADAVKDDIDVLEAGLASAEQRTAQKDAPKTSPSQSGETKTANAEPKQEQPAKPPVRQTAAQSLAAPKV